jgi:hypothetical protein
MTFLFLFKASNKQNEETPFATPVSTMIFGFKARTIT